VKPPKVLLYVVHIYLYRDLPNARTMEQPDEDLAARCETVLNTTMAEMDTYHTQKVEDFTALATEHLDGEIEFYEQVYISVFLAIRFCANHPYRLRQQVLARLRTARRAYDPGMEHPPGPRQTSLYERHLAQPRLMPDPLPQPAQHMFDSVPMRAVSQAVRDLVGTAAGAVGTVGAAVGATNVVGRGSILGRFFYGSESA